jgi:hypothetical protein
MDVFLDECLSREEVCRTYFLTPVAHELFECASHFVHVEVRRPASAPGIFLVCGRMRGKFMGMWVCVLVRVTRWVRVVMRREAAAVAVS